MVLRVGVHRHMALVQVGQLGLARRDHGALGDENGHRGALRLIVLFGDVEHLGPDHVGQGSEDIGQTLRVVLLVDIGDIVLLLPGGLGVAHIVDVEAQRLGQIVEAVKPHFLSHFPTLLSRPRQGLRYFLYVRRRKEKQVM